MNIAFARPGNAAIGRTAILPADMDVHDIVEVQVTCNLVGQARERSGAPIRETDANGRALFVQDNGGCPMPRQQKRQVQSFERLLPGRRTRADIARKLLHGIRNVRLRPAPYDSPEDR